jgi:hypothetical protein
MLEYNNHKKARERLDLLLESVHKEVKKGCVLRLLLITHKHLPNAMICPMGIVEQVHYALDASSSFKERLTHDQTFSLLEGSHSVSILTDLTQYPPMIYGFCFLRMVHQIFSRRHHYPDKHILLFMWARSQLYDAEAAKRSIVHLDGSLYMWLRLTFGGTSHSLTWCAFSEIQTDLANDIMADTSWDISDLMLP